MGVGIVEAGIVEVGFMEVGIVGKKSPAGWGSPAGSWRQLRRLNLFESYFA